MLQQKDPWFDAARFTLGPYALVNQQQLEQGDISAPLIYIQEWRVEGSKAKLSSCHWLEF